MTRCPAPPSLVGSAAILMTVLIVGCAAWDNRSDSIVRVTTIGNSNKASDLTLAGVKALHAGHVDRAANKFMAAVGADPEYGPAHNNLGLLHYEEGNLYQAVLAFERALELMPQDPSVYYNLALTLEAAGRVHEALDLYWQAVEMDRVNPMFLGNLVRLRVKLGETGPDVVAQLQDLVLVETRPTWRRWADRELALNYNDNLDRGPATPEFDSGRGAGSQRRRAAEFSLSDRIIDLSAPPQSLPKPRGGEPVPQSLRGPQVSPEFEFLPEPASSERESR